MKLGSFLPITPLVFNLFSNFCFCFLEEKKRYLSIREESESEFNWSNDCLLNNQVATEIDMAIQLKSLTFMDVFPIKKTGAT